MTRDSDQLRTRRESWLTESSRLSLLRARQRHRGSLGLRPGPARVQRGFCHLAECQCLSWHKFCDSFCGLLRLQRTAVATAVLYRASPSDARERNIDNSDSESGECHADLHSPAGEWSSARRWLIRRREHLYQRLFSTASERPQNESQNIQVLRDATAASDPGPGRARRRHKL